MTEKQQGQLASYSEKGKLRTIMTPSGRRIGVGGRKTIPVLKQVPHRKQPKKSGLPEPLEPKIPRISRRNDTKASELQSALREMELPRKENGNTGRSLVRNIPSMGR